MLKFRIYLILISLFVLSFLALSSTNTANADNTGPFSSGEGGKCGCDYAGFGSTCISLKPTCRSTAPYCIQGTCHVSKNDVGGTCGNDGDCLSWLTCNNHVCQPTAACSSFTSQNTCNSTGTKCFWYTGYKTESPRCVDNNGNMNSQACNGGHCYASQSCQYGQYCSATDDGPISTPPPYTNPMPPYNYPLPPTGSVPAPNGGGSSGGSTNPVTSAGSKEIAPAIPGVGYCATSDRGNPQSINSGSCGINNTVYDPSGTDYCNYYYGGSMEYFYKCSSSTAPPPSSNGGNTSSPAPSTSTTPAGPETAPCQNHGGVSTSSNSYQGALCDHQAFDPTKAASGAFCNATYYDRYLCQDGTTDDFAVPVSDQNYNGKSTCAQAPWCPSGAGGSSPVSPTPTDAPNCQTQGLTCGGVITCCSSLNLVCQVSATKTSLGTTVSQCQYGPGGAPTPTPGASTNCDQSNFGRWGSGCECPQGGGCGAGLGCYPEAHSGTISTGPFYCAPTGYRWCSASETYTSTPLTCSGSSAPTTTPSPTPKNLSYQADCPNVNVDGTTNACISGNSCPAGYVQNGGIGSTKGNQICTEYTGQTSVCCTKQTSTATGGTTPVVTNAPVTTAPVSTAPAPSKSLKGPLIPFSSQPCTYTAGTSNYVKGTYCDTNNDYYDVYCGSNNMTTKSVVGSC